MSQITTMEASRCHCCLNMTRQRNWAVYGGERRNISQEHRQNRVKLQQIVKNAEIVAATAAKIGLLECYSERPPSTKRTQLSTSTPIKFKDDDKYLTEVRQLHKSSWIPSHRETRLISKLEKCQPEKKAAVQHVIRTATSSNSLVQSKLSILSEHTLRHSHSPKSFTHLNLIGTITPKCKPFPVEHTDSSNKSRSKLVKLEEKVKNTPKVHLESLSMHKEPFAPTKMATKNNSPLPAPDRKTSITSQHVLRRIQDLQFNRDHLNENSMLGIAWEQLVSQAVLEENKTLGFLVDESGKKRCQTSQLVNHINNLQLTQEVICAEKLQQIAAKVRLFHDQMKKKGTSQPQIIYYGGNQVVVGDEKKMKYRFRDQFNYREHQIKQLRNCLVEAGQRQAGSLLTTTIFLCEIYDGTKTVNYKDGQPAVVKSPCASGGYYYIIMDQRSQMRGLITPNGSCTFYNKSGDVCYIHSGSCGFWFRSNGCIIRQWDPRTHPPPVTTFIINELVNVEVCRYSRYIINITLEKEHHLLITEYNKQRETFTFNNVSELRHKYGKLNAPNGYVSNASRDHKPSLYSKLCNPVCNDIPEGYDIMKAEANRVADKNKEAPFPTITELGEDMVDFFIKKKPSITASVADVEEISPRQLRSKTRALKLSKMARSLSSHLKPAGEESQANIKPAMSGDVRKSNATSADGSRVDLTASVGAFTPTTPSTNNTPAGSFAHLNLTLPSHKSNKSESTDKSAKKRKKEILSMLNDIRSRRSTLDARNWSDDDPLIRYYINHRREITNRTQETLQSWGTTLLQYLGMSEKYSATLTRTLFAKARKDYQLARK